MSSEAVSGIVFDDIYNKYYSQILSYFKKRLDNTADAEDLTSEVFLYCYKNLESYDSEKAKISTWIYLIAKSRYYNYCRDRKMTENIDDFENLISVSENYIENAAYIDDLREKLNEALSRLTERQRKIIVLKYFKGLSTTEIAGRTGTTPNNISVQQFKALKNLKKYFNEQGE